MAYVSHGFPAPITQRSLEQPPILPDGGQFGGFVCTVLIGYIVESAGSYSAPLWVVAAMVMTGAILFSLIDPTRPLFEEDRAGSSVG